jgi:hypothetical protein
MVGVMVSAVQFNSGGFVVPTYPKRNWALALPPTWQKHGVGPDQIDSHLKGIYL